MEQKFRNSTGVLYRYCKVIGGPGNIRELRNFAENIVVLHRGGTVTEYDLDNRFREGNSAVVIDHGMGFKPFSGRK